MMDEIKHNDEIDFRHKQQQVINLIKREFQNEINKRQDEVHLIQKRLLQAKKSLHLLKYVVVKSFYESKDLNINNKDSFKKTTDIQNRIHPAVKKLIGKAPLDFNAPLVRCREKPQNVQPPETPERIKVENNIDLTVNKKRLIVIKNENEENVPRGNQKKTKHEIIVGNISKYAPSNNAQDISSHKWMIYVRGPRNNPDISHIVKKIRFFLHPSYQPNDVIEIEESPFHLSRRGWGEFPVRVQIHFQYNFNKPIDIIHNLKLDQTQSGRQTLGNETLLNVWLYNNSDIREEDEILPSIKRIKQEITDVYETESAKDRPGSSKISIQENEINIIHNDSGFQVIKNEPNTESRTSENDEDDEPESDTEICYRDPNSVYDENRTFLVDHCYTDEIIHDNFIRNTQKYAISIPVQRFKTTRQIVYFLFKSLPLISHLAQNISYTCCYPYVAESLEEFSNWNIGKQRCSEWYRAKEIKELLILHNIPDQKLWTIKFIIMFGRAHAFTPFASYEIFQIKRESAKTIPNPEINIKVLSTYNEYIPISKLMENKKTPDIVIDNCIIDVENLNIEENIEQENTVKPKSISSETTYKLNPLCTYIRQCAEEIDISLEDEEIVPNVLHNSGERIILKAVMCLAEELIRTAWANKVISNKGRNLDHPIDRNDIYQVLLEREEFDIFTNDGLGKNMNV